MKKLLSLLSVLTISGTAVPTTIAAIPYQKEEIKLENSDINYQQTNNLENLIRNKRGINDGIEVHYDFLKRKIYVSFKPEFLEKLYFLKNYYNRQEFKNKFADKINSGIWKDYWVDSIDQMKKLGGCIYDNWETINNVWQNSDKKHRIKFISDFDHQADGHWVNHYGIKPQFAEIITTDTIIYPNQYYSNLEKSFNGDLNKKEINLGLIENDNDVYILHKIKEKYINLDVLQLDVDRKEEYSHFSKGFSAKVKVRNSSGIYSSGILRPTFIFNTKVNLNKINEIIKNDPKVITWINHLKDWNNDVKTELVTTVPQKTSNEKIEWKNRKKEDLKTYIRDWSYVINLIENELKLQEINSTIEGIKKDIDDLKLKINEIDKKITNSNQDLENCSNIGGIISASTGWIPYIGTLISTISGTTAAICTIANA